MADTTISVPNELRDAIKTEANRRGMKLYRMLAAVWRGWRMLSPSQQAEACVEGYTSPATTDSSSPAAPPCG